MITPREVLVTESIVCLATLGRCELEAAAAIIVLYHWERSPDAWIQFSRRQIADWIPTSSLLARAVANPFWNPDIDGFIKQGYIEGCKGIDDQGKLTQKFFDAIERPVIAARKAVESINFTRTNDQLSMNFETMGDTEESLEDDGK